MYYIVLFTCIIYINPLTSTCEVRLITLCHIDERHTKPDAMYTACSMNQGTCSEIPGQETSWTS